MNSKEIKLSRLFELKLFVLQDVIDYCLDNKIELVINDYSPKPPYVEYGLDDLFIVWENLIKLKNK